MSTNLQPKFEPITDTNLTEALSEMLDDHHTTGVSFVRDDGGEWWARTNVQGPGFTEARWWRINGMLVPATLDGLISGAQKALL
jgi:hypothetical protein